MDFISLEKVKKTFHFGMPANASESNDQQMAKTWNLIENLIELF